MSSSYFSPASPSETPSAALFNESKNPLLARTGLPRFEEIDASHVVPAVSQVVVELEVAFASLEANGTPSWEGVMEPLDALFRTLHRTWSPVTHLNGVKNSPALRDAHAQAQPQIIELKLKIDQSQAVYGLLKTLRDTPSAWNALEEYQKRAVSQRITFAELAGIALESNARARFNAIELELSQLSSYFSNNVLDSTRAFAMDLSSEDDIKGLPMSYLNAASQAYNKGNAEAPNRSTPEKGPWRITLDVPSYRAVLENSARGDLRESLYRAYAKRASFGATDNRPHIERILELRAEQAHMLGYGSYAELSLAVKMASSVDAIEVLHTQVRDAAFMRAKKDLAQLEALALAFPELDGRLSGDPLKIWDVSFWNKRLQEHTLKFTDEQVRPYLSLPRVLDGLFALAGRLFDISVKPVVQGSVPVWHPDVRYFDVCDAQENIIAGFYLDPYSRPENKRGGAWMDDCVMRRKVGAEIEAPVAYLVCNGTSPVGDMPSLMTFAEVKTLFHEFGHGLQHMLTRLDSGHVSGINGIEWDAVELPSQFMENWCYDKHTLQGLARHVDTGEPLPDELFEKILAARTFGSSFGSLRQVHLGLVDLALHRHSPEGLSGSLSSKRESPFELFQRIGQACSVVPLLEDDLFLCGFNHIFAGGYAAGYYSYLWAEVLSADAFQAFAEAGLENAAAVRGVGRRFRETILAQGGGRHPRDVFTDFRGREASSQALLAHRGLA